MKSVINKILLLLFTVVVVYQAKATTYTVNSTSDANTGSGTSGTLRYCITQANANISVPHTINFSIAGGGVQTITLTSALPAITRQMTINGYSQSGSVQGSISGRTIMIQIITTSSLTNVFDIQASNTQICGIAFSMFGNGNLFSSTAAQGTTISGVFIWGNYFNTGADGSSTTGSGYTFAVFGQTNATSPYASNLQSWVIGTNGDNSNDANEGNLFSQATTASGYANQEPVRLFYCDNFIIAGNTFGLKKDGITALQTFSTSSGSNYGIAMTDCTGMRVGTNGNGVSDVLERNVFAGMRSTAIVIFANKSGGTYNNDVLTTDINRPTGNNTIAGNYFGTNTTGTATGSDFKNGNAITIRGSSYNTIGSATITAMRNVIVNSNSQGIYINGEVFNTLSYPATNNTIAGNYIGVLSDGATASGNGSIGVFLNSPNTIPSGSVSVANTIISNNIIANNASRGVDIRPNTSGALVYDNTVTQNSIYNNTGLGINLGSSNTEVTVTPNDGILNTIASSGTNGNLLTDYAIITAGSLSGNSLTLNGFIGNSASGNSAYTGATVEFFIAGDDGNQNGQVISGDGLSVAHGEGKTYLGKLTAGTNGAFSGTIDVTGKGFVLGTSRITNTVTEQTAVGSTSEFGANTLSIAGNVYNDGDGLTDNLVDGTGTNVGTTLYAVLINTASNTVVATTTVASNGTYSFPIVSPFNYTIEITTNAATVGSAPPAVLLPTGYISTGENNGSGAGSDGNPNGILPLSAIGADIANANFGIQYNVQTSGTSFCDAGLYDKMVSSYHNTIVRQQDGSFVVWGEAIAPDGVSNILTPTPLTVANGYTYSGTVLFATAGSFGEYFEQQFVLTTTGLYAWGVEGIVVDAGLTSSTAIQAILPAGTTSAGLPAGINPTDVKTFTATDGALVILTNAGAVYVLGSRVFNYGDGSATADAVWHRVQTSAGVNLANVVQLRASANTVFAVTGSNQWYTWGLSTFLGNGTAVATRSFATQMTVPAAFASLSDVKMIGVTSKVDVTSPTSITDAAYFAINATDKMLYCMGTSNINPGSAGVLGLGATTSQLTWANVRNQANTGPLANVKFISMQEHDGIYMSAAAILGDGTLLTWGRNSSSMIGAGSSNASINLPAVPAGFTAGTDKALYVEPGGHFTVYVKDGSPNYCYVGHHINGSFGDGSAVDAIENAFNCSATSTPIIVCSNYILKGTLFDDANGLTDNLVNGTGTNAGGLNAVLTDQSTGKVIATTVVASDGTYLFNVNIGPGNYSVEITKNTATLGSAPPAVALPSGWVSTGEVSDAGTGAGNDGNVNGILSLTVTSANINNANFGIDQLPSGVAISYQINPVPTRGSTHALTSAYRNMLPLGYYDPEDCASVCPSAFGVVITALTQMNGNVLAYNGTIITSSNLPFTIPSYNPNLLTVTFNQSGLSSFTFHYQVIDAAGVQSIDPDYTAFWGGTVLTVNLLSFTAEQQGDAALLKWSTATGSANDKFTVERSADGSQWTALKTIGGTGNTATRQDYNFTDNSPLSGDNYYRIKQVDKNGNNVYSETRRLKFGEKWIVSLSPNPVASGEVKLVSNQPVGMIRITDLQGRIVLITSMPVTTAQGSVDKELNTASFAAGTYIVQIINNRGKIQTLKLIKW